MVRERPGERAPLAVARWDVRPHEAAALEEGLAPSCPPVSRSSSPFEHNGRYVADARGAALESALDDGFEIEGNDQVDDDEG